MTRVILANTCSYAFYKNIKNRLPGVIELLLRRQWHKNAEHQRGYKRWKVYPTFFPHITHEANAQSIFSVSDMLSDQGQDPPHLLVLVRVKRHHFAYDSVWETV